MAKPQKSTAQSEVPGLVKKGPLYYLKRDWQLYALMLLPMVFIIVFKYFAYTGLSVAFLDYKIGKGYAGSKFVGLKIFEKVFKHRDFTKAVVNTLLLNVLDLIFSFPMPIILALLLNEIRVKWFKRTTQTLLYLPHFLSWVVIGAVAYQMFATQSGVVNALIANAGKSPIPFLQEDGWWLFSYVLIGVWQTMGWGTIIYLAAITNVNSELYEAAKVDGANRWQQCLHVTLPCIRSTIVVMLIMQLGKLMGGSFERIVALSNACITNHAHSGLTTESFTSEGHWDIVKPRLRAGDICLYQFGHNDQKLAHLQAYGGYTDRLRTYIKEARTAGAVPVLVTPLARNSWKDAAHYNDFLADFADAVLTLGKAENVMVLDLHTWAMALMQQDGLETAKRWFYPGDYTHTNDFGAYKMAGFVAHALGDALGLMVTDAPEWTPTPPFVPLEAPADCAIPAPEGDPFADYDATRPNDTLTRAEALELAIKALKLFPINVYNDLYSDIVGHETYAGTIQCAAQNDLIPPEWVADGSLYPNQTVTAADFLAVLIPGAAGRRPLADAVPVPDSVPVYARRAVGQAVAEGLIAPEALTKPLNRSNAAEICRRLHI